MVRIRGCANCSAAAAEGSTLCVDCLTACNVRVFNEIAVLLAETEIYGEQALKALKEKDKEIEDLSFRLKLQTKLYREVSKEYQELLTAVKEDVCKKRDGQG